MTRKKIIKKMELLKQEIEVLIKTRGTKQDKYDTNKKINNLKFKYNFYNNLLKIGATK